MDPGSKDTGARPKDARTKDFTHSQATSSSEANELEDETITLEGNHRRVNLTKGWDIVHCKVVCEKDVVGFDIYGEIHPCILQYLTRKNMIYDFNKLFPPDMKITLVAPKVLEIKMTTWRSSTDVIHILKSQTVQTTSMKEVNFTSVDELESVVLGHLDKQMLNLLTSFELGQFYYRDKNKFILMIVWPVFNHTGNNYQKLAQDLEVCGKLVQQADSVDRLKQEVQVTKKCEDSQDYIRRERFPSQAVSDFEILGVFNELKKAFRFEFDVLQNEVQFTCPSKDELESLVKEFYVYISRLRKIDVDFLPVEAWNLLLMDSDRRDQMIKQHIKCDFYIFIAEDYGSNKKMMMLCISSDNKSTLYWSLKDCFHHLDIREEILQQPMVQQYLNEIKDDICVCKHIQQPNVARLYYMLYMQESISKLKIFYVDFLPMEAWPLLLAENDKRDEFLKHQLECEANFLVLDGHRMVMVCISQKDVDTIYKILEDNICLRNGLSEILQQPMVLRYLDDNTEDICRYKSIEKPHVTRLHFLQYQSENMHKALDGGANRCDAFMCKYLKSKGANLLRQFEDDNNVTISISEQFIECPTGPLGDRLSMMKALNSQLLTAVHHEMDIQKCFNIACSYDLKQKLTHIENIHSCCLKSVPVLTNKKLPDICKVDGADYMATWFLGDMKTYVSVVSGEVKNMLLDFLIVPVNSSMFGEDLLTAQGDMASLGEYFSNNREKAKLGKIIVGNFGDEMKPKHVVAIVVSGTELVSDAERRVMLEGNELQDVIKKFIEKMQITYGQVSNIGVFVPQDETQFSIQLEDFIEPFHKTTLSKKLHIHFCVKSNVEKWIQLANKCSKKIYRRIVHPMHFGIFSTPDDMCVKVTEISLLDVKAECLVVSVGNDFNLSHGFVAKLIKDAAGPGLQDELNNAKLSSKNTNILAARPWRLSNNGVKLLLFVYVPHWKYCDRKTEKLKKLVEESLFTADKYYCKSVAFPVFGIGNLEYPMRDAIVALFDAVETFQKESVIQAISEIHISAPPINQNNYVFELLQMEEKRRFQRCQKYGIIFQRESKDICCLEAGDENVNFKVVKKDDFHLLDLSVEYVHVKFDQSQVDKKPIVLSLSEVSFHCGKSKDALKKAMEDVVMYCEYNRITSIHVSLDTGFRFSEYDQIKIVSDAVRKTIHSYLKYPERVYKYLKHIHITVSEAFTFVPETLSNNEHTFWPSTRQVDCLWKRIQYPTAMYGMNIVIIGAIGSVQNALKDVHKLLSTSDEGSGDVFYDAKEKQDDQQNSDVDEYKSIMDETATDDSGTPVDQDENMIVDKYKSIIEETATNDSGTPVDQDENMIVEYKSIIEETATDDSGTPVDQDENMINDQNKSIEEGAVIKESSIPVDHSENIFDDEDVKAELNLGVVEFLKLAGDTFYIKWVEEMKKLFGIHVLKEHTTKLFVKGKLDMLLKFEEYIENDFPDMDDSYVDKDGTFQLSFNEQHYSKEQQSYPEVLVPLLRGNAEEILRNYHEEVGKIVSKFQKSFKIVDNGFLVSCPKEHVSEMQKAFLDLNDRLLKFRKFQSLKNLEFDVSRACLKFRNVVVTVVCSNITDCSVECIVSSVNAEMHHDFGIARSIANMAGKHYKDECKAGKLRISECKHIQLDQSKKLKCQGILNVNCFPASRNRNVNLEFLSELRTCITNCCVEAEKQKYSSMALPMLRTGQLGLDVSLCAQECFRAIDGFTFQHLKEVQFVSNDRSNVNTFVKTLAATSSSKSGQESMVFSSLEISVKSSNTQLHILHEGKFHPDVKAHVQFDRVFKQSNVEEQITCNTHGPGYVLKAPEPTWQHSSETYERVTFDTVICVLQKAKQLKIPSLILPIVRTSDRTQAKLFCTAMLQAVCKFCKGNPKAMELIQIVSSDQSLITSIMDMVVSSLPDSK